MAGLVLSYEPDDPYHGQLTGLIQSGAYSGKGTIWISPIDVKETFIVAAKKYPLSPEAPPRIEGGYWEDKGSRLRQCHLRVSIEPFDALGALLVRAECATEAWESPDKSRQHTLTARFLTEYAALDQFASDFEKVLEGKLEAATLRKID